MKKILQGRPGSSWKVLARASRASANKGLALVVIQMFFFSFSNGSFSIERSYIILNNLYRSRQRSVFFIRGRDSFTGSLPPPTPDPTFFPSFCSHKCSFVGRELVRNPYLSENTFFDCDLLAYWLSWAEMSSSKRPEQRTPVPPFWPVFIIVKPNGYNHKPNLVG